MRLPFGKSYFIGSLAVLLGVAFIGQYVYFGWASLIAGLLLFSKRIGDLEQVADGTRTAPASIAKGIATVLFWFGIVAGLAFENRWGIFIFTLGLIWYIYLDCKFFLTRDRR